MLQIKQLSRFCLTDKLELESGDGGVLYSRGH